MRARQLVGAIEFERTLLICNLKVARKLERELWAMKDFFFFKYSNFFFLSGHPGKFC